MELGRRGSDPPGAQGCPSRSINSVFWFCSLLVIVWGRVRPNRNLPWWRHVARPRETETTGPPIGRLETLWNDGTLHGWRRPMFLPTFLSMGFHARFLSNMFVPSMVSRYANGERGRKKLRVEVERRETNCLLWNRRSIFCAPIYIYIYFLWAYIFMLLSF